MGWIERHAVLLSACVLVALVVAGLLVLALRGLALVRATKAAQRRLDQPVGDLRRGLADAERGVSGLNRHQGDLTDTLERVGTQTTELSRLLAIAGEALSVLRAPLRYLGK